MESRFILWHRGQQVVSIRELKKLLPRGASVVHESGHGAFLVEGEESRLREAFGSRAGWLIAPERFLPHAGA